jgi:glycosyltransferase involved in cell wall biosynthesis
MLEQYSWARRQQALFPRYTAMVVASDHMRREYARYDGLASRITTIPLFAGAPAAAAARDVDVAFLGRLTPLKGADVLLDALERAGRTVGRPIRAVMAGEGPMRASLSERAKRLRAGGAVDVDLPGWIDRERRDALLARAALLALPSRWPEPFGLVGLEAARYGAPAVAFDVGGVRTWLEDGVNGAIVPQGGGAAALGSAIAAILADPARLASLSAGAIGAATKLSAAAHVAALLRVFEACRPSGIS